MKKKNQTRPEPWMLFDEYHVKPPFNPLCIGCQKDCKQRTQFELECEFYTATEQKTNLTKSE